MDISSNEIELIVKQVIAGLGAPEKSQAPGPSVFTLSPLNRQSGAGMTSASGVAGAGSMTGTTVYGGKTGDDGVFDDIEDAIEAAYQAQRDYVANYKVYDRQRIIEAIRRTARDHVETMCLMIV